MVEQIVRPTGLTDPPIEIRPVAGQVDSLMEEIRARAEKNERVLVTTLTKRMAEDLAEYFTELGLRVRYLHSEIETLERVKILRALRAGEFDALIGINLLREGLDLPEVSLVAILDADKEGFLRSTTSLIQTVGRAARHINGSAILFADTHHRIRCRRPSMKPTAGAQLSSGTTRKTTSRPNRSSSRSIPRWFASTRETITSCRQWPKRPCGILHPRNSRRKSGAWNPR